MKHIMKKTVYTAGISAAVAAAALGLGGCGAGAQMPDTLKVQKMCIRDRYIVSWWCADDEDFIGSVKDCIANKI